MRFNVAMTFSLTPGFAIGLLAFILAEQYFKFVRRIVSDETKDRHDLEHSSEQAIEWLLFQLFF